MRTAHITVHSREEAWREAGKLFPTDYELDDQSTANAGYPIWKSSAEDNNSWISDLNTSLELNVWNGKVLETTKIHIEEYDEEPFKSNNIKKEGIVSINFTNGVLTIISKKNGSVVVIQYTKESLGNNTLNII